MNAPKAAPARPFGLRRQVPFSDVAGMLDGLAEAEREARREAVWPLRSRATSTAACLQANEIFFHPHQPKPNQHPVISKLASPSAPVRVASSALATATAQYTLLVGLDWGTNLSSLHAARRDSTELLVQEQIPTVVGYAQENVFDGILPRDARMLFGKLAQKHRAHMRLVRPLQGGVIADREAARDFARHLRSRLPDNNGEMRVVIGMPASSDLAARENARAAVQGIFQKVIFVREPFLAALCYPVEDRLSDSEYQDPVLNSLYVDIGAGSTDVCLVQGRYPTVDDQLSVPFAGDAVDQIILEAALSAYPDSGLTLTKVREAKKIFLRSGRRGPAGGRRHGDGRGQAGEDRPHRAHRGRLRGPAAKDL